MGWIRDGAYGHEGWVANVLTDGRVAGASTAGGVIVHELTTDDIAAEREVRRYPGSNHVDVVIPWNQVAAWRLTCECGWTGSEQPARVAPDSPSDGRRDCDAFPDIEEAFAREWSAHVEPFAALTELDQLVDELRSVEARINDTVRLARAGGASWSQIGRAVGLSKQGAQQRWGQLLAEPGRDVTASIRIHASDWSAALAAAPVTARPRGTSGMSLDR